MKIAHTIETVSEKPTELLLYASGYRDITIPKEFIGTDTTEIRLVIVNPSRDSEVAREILRARIISELEAMDPTLLTFWQRVKLLFGGR